ncbi:MAG: LPS export ABC transporter periplasmic protein LptC [bacterium]
MVKRYFLNKKAFLIVGGVLIITLLVFLRQTDRQKVSAPVQEPIVNKADMEVKKMELFETEAGDLAWNLKAERAQVYEKEGVAYLQHITLEYLLGEGEAVILTGDKGTVNLSQKNVFLEGNVDASSYRIQLKTNTLSWNREKRLLTTEDPVWLRRKNIEITGKGMVADMNLKKIKLSKQIRTAIY